MDAQTFLDNIATIADAPGEVQRLRDLVVGLGVGGGLPTGSVTDEPASEVIDRARSELGLSGPRPVPAGALAELGALPTGWAWAELGEIADHQLGKMLNKKTMTGRPVRYLRSVNIRDGFIDLSDLNEMLMQEYELEKYAIRDGDVLVIEGGDAGRSAIWSGPNPDGLAFQNQLHRLRPVAGILSAFVLLVLRHHRSRGEIAARSTGVTIKHFSAGALRRLPVPLPPLAEQDRIVAKVAELMGLCDELEARQERRHRATTRFRGSALHALTEAETPDDLRHAWKRVATNWPALTSHAEGVRSLRPTVLQLAIEGRLVPRLPREGTADQTIAAIDEERTRLASTGSIAKPRARAEVRPERTPFDIPGHWRWVHVEDVVIHIVDCLHRTPPYADVGFPAIRTCDVEPGRVLLDQALLVDEATYHEQTRRLVPHAGDVLYSREGGRFGIAAVVPDDTKLCLSQRMMQFRCAGAVVPDYFSWFLNSPLGFGQAAEDVGGSASPHVNIKSIRRFVMPFPPRGEQSRIVTTINRMLGTIERLAISSERQDEHASRFAESAISALITS